MDGYSLKKRQEDGICRLGLNAPERLKQRSHSTGQIATLKQEQKLAKEWHAQLKRDLSFQRSNICALHVAIKQSRDHGGPRYRHVGPVQGQERPSEYIQALSGLATASVDLAASKQQVDTLHKSITREQWNSLDAVKSGQQGVTSFEGWFAKYGEPKRQAELGEKFRTVCLPSRRRPFLDAEAQARTLRLGTAVWNEAPRGTWQFRTRLGSPPKRIT
eukprot:TRINITY_DN75080_c0_g1_i1.p1 TRINITY_DN75080_c0_g1~~TRINITY_DN75080_c0_g1_i1.p1  ORF type:complete len:217 (+),score=38.61 TRINITY_DN75080_c0_g1_i1:46-696(+)